MILILILILMAMLLMIQNRFKTTLTESFTGDNINHIWMYWENKPGKTKPNFLKLCVDTVRKHCGTDEGTCYQVSHRTIWLYWLLWHPS